MNHPIPHAFSFDPSYGYDEAALRRIRAPDNAPEDFISFWRECHRQAGTIPLDLTVETLASPRPGFRCLRCQYTVWPDYRVGAWILVPEGAVVPDLGVVVGHGYGGRDGPEPERAGTDRVVIFPVAPGFQISPDSRLPHNDCARHVVHGIEKPETYLLASCAAALWRAVDVLEELFQKSFPRLHYIGWSFGGGMGALMLPWEKRYTSAELGQVTFANHPFRLRHACVGSGEAVRQLWKTHPEIQETLRYYDAASSLKHLHIPVAFGCSNFDPAVPPPGQWSAANAHPGPKVISPFPVGHLAEGHPDQDRAEGAHQQRVLDFFGFAGLSSVS